MLMSLLWIEIIVANSPFFASIQVYPGSLELPTSRCHCFTIKQPFDLQVNRRSELAHDPFARDIDATINVSEWQ